MFDKYTVKTPVETLIPVLSVVGAGPKGEKGDAGPKGEKGDAGLVKVDSHIFTTSAIPFSRDDEVLEFYADDFNDEVAVGDVLLWGDDEANELYIALCSTRSVADYVGFDITQKIDLSTPGPAAYIESIENFVPELRSASGSLPDYIELSKWTVEKWSNGKIVQKIFGRFTLTDAKEFSTGDTIVEIPALKYPYYFEPYDSSSEETNGPAFMSVKRDLLAVSKKLTCSIQLGIDILQINNTSALQIRATSAGALSKNESIGFYLTFEGRLSISNPEARWEHV